MTATTTGRPHGYARYRLDGCRCNACGWARHLYDANRDKQIAAGTWKPWTDPQPVRDHLVKLKAAGIGERRISELTGVTRSTITGLLRGRRGAPPSTRVRPDTAVAILALAVADAGPADGVNVDGTGTARRIRALCCLGWTLTEQASRVGWTVTNYQALTSVHPVTAKTARLIADLYDALSMHPAGDTVVANRTRQRAADKGWVPPLAWDDEDIDKPAALPATTPGNGRELLAAWIINYHDAAGQGLDRKQIAARLEMSPEAVKDRLRRARQNGLIESATPADAAAAAAETKRELAPCGTPAAYKRHHSRGEPIDPACRDARAGYLRDRRAAKTTTPTASGGAS